MPGRIRLRCGRNAFSLDEGYSITSVLMAQTIVTDAKASSINGSLLIFYIDDSRSLLLDFIDTLVPAELPVIPPAERDTTSEVDAGFQYALAFRIVRRLLFRGLLPSPVRHVITLFRAVPYVCLLYTSSESIMTPSISKMTASIISSPQKNISYINTANHFRKLISLQSI